MKASNRFTPFVQLAMAGALGTLAAARRKRSAA